MQLPILDAHDGVGREEMSLGQNEHERLNEAWSENNEDSFWEDLAFAYRR